MSDFFLFNSENHESLESETLFTEGTQRLLVNDPWMRDSLCRRFHVMTSHSLLKFLAEARKCSCGCSDCCQIPFCFCFKLSSVPLMSHYSLFYLSGPQRIRKMPLPGRAFEGRTVSAHALPVSSYSTKPAKCSTSTTQKLVERSHSSPRRGIYLKWPNTVLQR